MSIVIAPVQDAAEYHDRKTAVGTKLRSRELERLPTELRNAAQMSAGVESARVIQSVQDKTSEILNHTRNALGGRMDRSAFIRDMMVLAENEGLTPADPAKRGTIEDITSETRLGLIYEMQTGMAYGYANRRAGMDPDALDAFPAQELVRISPAKVPRNWEVRWASAGQEVGWVGAVKAPHIALKTSPIWSALSRFGNPYPPFDYNSGMWVDDIGLEDALRLGLVKRGQKLEPPQESFTDGLSGSVKGVSPELRAELEKEFGDKIVIEGDTARWAKAAPPPEPKPVIVDQSKLPPYKVDTDATARPIQFDTWQEGTAWANKYIHPLEQGFDQPQVDALKRAQEGTQELNGKLWRKEELTLGEQKWHDELKQTIQSAPPLPRMVLHKFADGPTWGQYKVGTTVPMLGFTSATLADTAEIKRKYSKGAHIEIHVPAGARGMFMDRISGNPKFDTEAEILFPAGTNLHIQSKVWRGDHWHIVAFIE
jgi:hypothetical protein